MPIIQFNYPVSNPDSVIPLLVENNGHIYYPDGREITQRIYRNNNTNYSNPYKFINLTHPVTGIRLRAQVSRIICQAYHPIPNPELYQCDHKDNNPSNNTSSNLQWLSISSNNSRKHSRLMKSKHHKRTNHSHQCILARNLHTGETRIFINGHHAARELKCSHVLVYLAIQRIKTTHARFWELQWIDENDPRAKPQLNSILQEKEQARLQKQQLKQKQREEARKLRKSIKEQLKLQSRELRETVRKQQELLKEHQKEELWNKHKIAQIDPATNQIVKIYKSPYEAVKETSLNSIWKCIKKI